MTIRTLVIGALLGCATCGAGVAQGQPPVSPSAAVAAAEAKAEASRLQAERDREEVLRLRIEAGKAAEAELAARQAAAQPSAAAGAPARPPEAAPAKAEQERNKDAGNGAGQATAGQKFGGIEFGVGISFTLDVGKNNRVSEAEVVNGIVRVKDEDNGRARIMLESHYFFTPDWAPFGVEPGDFGWGPFIALQPGTDNIVEAVALGAMMGFRRPVEGTESFNIGLGVVVDPNTRILGEGIRADQPLPIGETTVRYKEQMQTGVLLLASFGF
jgi:hypothetical protein